MLSVYLCFILCICAVHCLCIHISFAEIDIIDFISLLFVIYLQATFYNKYANSFQMHS